MIGKESISVFGPHYEAASVKRACKVQDDLLQPSIDPEEDMTFRVRILHTRAERLEKVWHANVPLSILDSELQLIRIALETAEADLALLIRQEVEKSDAG